MKKTKVEGERVMVLDRSYFENIRGAVYFPARAYNAYQTFTMFDPVEFERDLRYAVSARVNAYRLFVSYNYYLEDRDSFFDKVETMVSLADKYNIRIMPVLFEDCGVEFNPESANDRDPYTAVCVRYPGKEIEHHPERFSEVKVYLRDFMDRYKDDHRLLAIEIMNEPHKETGNVEFARYIAEYVGSIRGSVPLTIGCIMPVHNLYFADIIDIYQFHDNFPVSLEDFKAKIVEAKHIESVTGKPFWITEWQRLREGGPGWGVADIPEEHKLPKLSSLADIIHEAKIGSFFWSLMVKPAYLPEQRINGTFNGLFHEDGSVYSAEDFRKVSEQDTDIRECAELPKWYQQDIEKK